MLRQALDQSTWTVRATSGNTDTPKRWRSHRFDALVPGCVHLDLIRAGVIGDPALNFHERDQFWVGNTDWEYRCLFAARPGLFKHDHIDLVCEGLDTIASLTLNGVPIGTAANMFHPHRFDIANSLKPRENELVIRFRSPLKHIRDEESRLGSRPVNGDWDPYIFIRKAACNFGWDWGPKVPTVGVWKGIRLEGWSHARLESVRPLITKATATLATVDVCIDICDALTQQPVAGSGSLQEDHHTIDAEVTLRGPGGFSFHATTPLNLTRPHSRPGRTSASSPLTIPIKVRKPHLWWPLGHGKQPLYKLTVQLRHRRKILDTTSATIGLRTASLNTKPDDHGSRFQIEINGKPIFCKGANWIPDGLFPAAITAKQLRTRIGQAASAGMNMLRVWGGGYYEDEAFYTECDRRGIMVWQDFMFACAMYPEEPPYPSLIEHEARYNVARLSRHPSVVLWCGGNECVWGYQHWGWRKRLKPGQSWGKRYYLKLLPAVLTQLDPTTPYWPNSPWSGTMRRSVLDPHHGDRHTWDAHFDAYRDTIPRFLSEFGRQAPATLATLASALPKRELRVDSEAMTHRQRATGGNALIYAAIGEQLRTPIDFEEWTYAAQLLQTRATRIGLEWARANQPICMGVLPWQLNDCWPALSWSLIDSAGRPKPALTVARQAYAPRLAMIHLVGPQRHPIAYLANDTDTAWTTTLVARRMSAAGKVLALKEKEVHVPAQSAAACWDLHLALGPPGDPSAEYIELVGYPSTATFFVPDNQFHYPPPQWSHTVRSNGHHQLVIEITARTMLRDLALVGGGMEGVNEPAWAFGVTQPGQRVKFHMQCESISAAIKAIPGSIRCANQFGVIAV